MENTAVFPTAHDGVIGGETGAVAVEFMQNFPFQLVFEHARTAFLHCAGMSQRGNFTSAAHHLQLFRRFKQAHLMHHRPPVNHRAGRLQILAPAFTQFFQRVEDDFVSVGIFALGKIDRIEAVKQLEQLLVNFAERQSAVDAQLRWRGLLPQTTAEPDLCGQIADAVKQHAMVVGVVAFNQHQQGFRLIKSREVPKIAVLPVGVF